MRISDTVKSKPFEYYKIYFVYDASNAPKNYKFGNNNIEYYLVKLA